VAAANENVPVATAAVPHGSYRRPAQAGAPKGRGAGKEGRVSESNQEVLEEKRRPVHNFAFGNILYRTRL